MQRMLDLIIPGGAHMSIIICDSFIIQYHLMRCNTYQGNWVTNLTAELLNISENISQIVLKRKGRYLRANRTVMDSFSIRIWRSESLSLSLTESF